MKYSLTELLGCRYPVIQGPMGVSCNPELVATVLEAGGRGLLATVYTARGQFNEVSKYLCLSKGSYKL